MNGKKQVLFVGPVYMDIYKDVIDGFKMLDCDVEVPDMNSTDCILA